MKLVTHEDKIFVVDDGVLEPKKDAFLFWKHIQTKEDDVVLDLGTGSGFYAIMIASKVRKVIATDIDSKAVRNAKKNIVINNLEDKIEILQGDMFEPVEGRKFDLIISSLPQMPTPSWKLEENIISIPDDGGLTGRELIDKFIKRVKGYLNDKGRFYLFHFNFLDTKKTIKILESKGLKAFVCNSLEISPGRLTSERIKHIKNLNYKLEFDNEKKKYKIKIDVIKAIKN